MSLEDIPTYFSDATGINVTTAQLILSLIIITGLLFSYLVMSYKKPSPMISLVMVFMGELISLALGWLPFWVLIMTIAVVALGISIQMSDLLGG